MLRNIFKFFVILITVMACSSNEDPTVLEQRLVQIKDNFDQTEDFKYLGDGNLLNRRLRSNFGETLHQYVYDLNGTLTSITRSYSDGETNRYNFRGFTADSAYGEYIGGHLQSSFKFLFDDHFITYYEENWEDGSRLEVTINSDDNHKANQIRFAYYQFDGLLDYYQNYKILEWEEHKPSEFSSLEFSTPVLPGYTFTSKAFKRIAFSLPGVSPVTISMTNTFDEWGNITKEQIKIPDFGIDNWKEYSYETIRK